MTTLMVLLLVLMLGTYTSGTTLPAVIKDDVLELAAVSALCNRPRSGVTPNSRHDSSSSCSAAPPAAPVVLAPCPRRDEEEETIVLLRVLCDS